MSLGKNVVALIVLVVCVCLAIAAYAYGMPDLDPDEIPTLCEVEPATDECRARRGNSEG